ncbi:MAG: hypothetical protein TECD_00954 [Hyphomicrobiaceae bacterium hypho_1]
MVDTQRYAPLIRHRNLKIERPAQGIWQVCLARSRPTYKDVYYSDHIGGKGKWFISTCVAAVIGALIITFVIIGSLDSQINLNSVLDQISQSQNSTQRPIQKNKLPNGLNWVMPKSDKLKVASGALSARYTIHEQVNVQRDNRPFIKIRSYARIVTRLAPASQSSAISIPRFNPLNLYATEADDGKNVSIKSDAHKFGKIIIHVVNFLPENFDYQEAMELDTNDIKTIVQRTQMIPEQITETSLYKAGELPSDLTPNYLSNESFNLLPLDQIGSNITVLNRNLAPDVVDDEEMPTGEFRVIRVGKGDTVIRILQRMGAPSWLAGNMINAANTIVEMNRISPGQEIHIHMVESVTEPGLLEPAGFSLFGLAHNHLVTVKRDDAGEFRANAKIDPETLVQSIKSGANHGNLNTLYSAIYDAGLTQNLDPLFIRKILRIHAYTVDFRRRLRNGDQIELFFELLKQPDGTVTPGELFYTAITTGGEISQFWRYRSRDGIVDYYDERGENSRKFLMRKPVRGPSIRLTSGFGFRMHPILQQRRMHTGVDWAGPRGTPILAAGDGLVEEARRRGAYGNYIRIKHANGYDTTYSHMHKFGPKILKGVKVKQGQIIGYIGSTGLSSGPHLHYEIMVNKRFVNPLKIKAQRARSLVNIDLLDFQRERGRMISLLKRPPVKTNID